MTDGGGENVSNRRGTDPARRRGGVAEYFAMDPKVVRVIWAALALFGPAALAYLIAALVLPEKGKA